MKYTILAKRFDVMHLLKSALEISWFIIANFHCKFLLLPKCSKRLVGWLHGHWFLLSKLTCIHECCKDIWLSSNSWQSCILSVAEMFSRSGYLIIKFYFWGENCISPANIWPGTFQLLSNNAMFINLLRCITLH